MSRKASKRDASGKIASSKCFSSESLGMVCLPVTQKQLQELWKFDNECANRYMGAPLRMCSFPERNPLDNSECKNVLSSTEMVDIKTMIEDIWKKASPLFEIFKDPKQPDLGYRMRVRQFMPVKISIKDVDCFYFGWCASSPENGTRAHVYNRSPVEPEGYMGGPASYLNWGAGKSATVRLVRPVSRIARHLVKLEANNLVAGVELVWNYGSEQKMPQFDEWFHENCCSIALTEPSVARRHERKKTAVPFMNTERCVLCGEKYSCNNKERRIQRKQHLVIKHADFLGSTWDGTDHYMQQEVKCNEVLIKADMLNSFLHSITKDLKWNVYPACKVLSKSELDKLAEAENKEAALETFRDRCKLLKSAGILVLRGWEEVTTYKHLLPVSPSVWKVLNWKNGTRPKVGHYAAPQELLDPHSKSVESNLLQFCLKHLSDVD